MIFGNVGMLQASGGSGGSFVGYDDFTGTTLNAEKWPEVFKYKTPYASTATTDGRLKLALLDAYSTVSVTSSAYTEISGTFELTIKWTPGYYDDKGSGGAPYIVLRPTSPNRTSFIGGPYGYPTLLLGRPNTLSLPLARSRISVGILNSAFSGVNGGGYVNGTFTEGVEYSLRWIINWPTRRMSLYIDDVLSINSVSFDYEPVANLYVEIGNSGTTTAGQVTTELFDDLAFTQRVTEPFDPADLVPLVALDGATSTTFVSSGGITTWQDSSTAGNDFSAADASAPTFESNIQNSLGGIRFASGKYLSRSAFSGATAATVFLVAKIDADPAGAATNGLWSLGNTGTRTLYPYTDGVISDTFASTTNHSSGNPSTSMTNAHLYCAQSADGFWQSYFNGVRGGYTWTNTFGWPATMVIGKSTSDYPMAGYIFELRVYNGVLSLDARQYIEGVLAHKWGIAGSLPSTHPYKTSPP